MGGESSSHGESSECVSVKELKRKDLLKHLGVNRRLKTDLERVGCQSME
jgi:hypothetical protein